MGKMNLNRYRPQDDSSAGTEQLRTRHPHLQGHLILVVRSNDCECGCTQPPAGPKSKFRMGHDARYRGELIRAHCTDTPVTVVTSTTDPDCFVTVGATAMELAEVHGWGEYLRIAAEREQMKLASKADRASAALLEKATGERVGDEKLIRVGRWEYTGQVVAVFEVNGGKEIEYRYVTKSGEVKRHTVLKKKGDA